MTGPTIPDGWRPPTNPDALDDDGRSPICERNLTLDDAIDIFGEAGRAAWPAIEQIVADGGSATVTIYGRPNEPDDPGPKYATLVDDGSGDPPALVHGDEPLTEQGLAATREVIAAAKRRIGEQ